MTKTALPTEAALATERVRDALTATGKFIPVDRQRIDRVMAELGLKDAGCVAIACAVKIGKTLGVRRVVTGTLTLKDITRWVVSGYLVDVDGARTLHTSTVESEGGSLTFIDDAVAVVAARIAEVPPPAEALASGQIKEHAPRELWPADKKPAWAIAVDIPVAYTFASDKVNRHHGSGGGGFGKLDRVTTSDIEGLGLFLMSPWHVGIGAEQYTIKQNLTLVPGCPALCDGFVKLRLTLFDIVLDFPLRYANLAIGYGSGEADVDIALDPSQQGPLPIRRAHVDQVLVMAGLPLGRHWDVHLTYRQVSVQQKDLLGAGQQQPPFDTLQASGELYSLGARIAF